MGESSSSESAEALRDDVGFFLGLGRIAMGGMQLDRQLACGMGFGEGILGAVDYWVFGAEW